MSVLCNEEPRAAQWGSQTRRPAVMMRHRPPPPHPTYFLHLDVCPLGCVPRCQPRFTDVDPTVPRDKRVVTTMRSIERAFRIMGMLMT